MKLTGLLIVNAFLNQEKYHELYNWILESAKRHNIEIILKTNAELINLDYSINGKKPDFVLFWDKDTKLARLLENEGLRLFNRASAIETCDNKALTYIYLQKKVRMPKTILAPMTFSNIGYTDFSFLYKIDIPFPIVIKECFGSFGAQVYLAENFSELKKIVINIGSRPILFQELIKESYGRDIRINIVGGEVCASMMRYSQNGDFRTNISNGGKMEEYNPTPAEIQLAKDASDEIGLDFCGVDILFSEDGNPILCEVNSNPHFKSIFDCTGINVADYIMKYIIKVLSI